MPGSSGPRAAVLALGVALLAGGPAHASAQVIQPDDPFFWAASGVVLVASWQMDAGLRRDRRAELVAPFPLADQLAAFGYELGGSSILAPTFLATLAVAGMSEWPVEPGRLLNAAAGVVAANLVTEGIKFTVGRGRPRDIHDPRRFQPFSRSNAWMAFPSGHATTGFSAAAALAEEFDLGGFEVVGYGLAGLIAWSRVYHDAHWTSDTVAGAIVGIVVARSTVAWLHRQQAGEEPVPGAASAARIPLFWVTVPLP